jgi:hypothetical protein
LTRRAQLSLNPADRLDDQLSNAIDSVNSRYGNFVMTYAAALDGKRIIKQKIPFGSTEYFDLLISGYS